MAPRQQRKPTPEASPAPPRRTTIPPPANDNRAKQRAALIAGVALVAAIAGYVAYRLLA
jgi:hypothetical protein